MTPQEFAQMLRRVADAHEASWQTDLQQYSKTLRDCCEEHCPQPWPEIVHTLLFPGYADVWDWCDTVLK